jgi:hypothetical protein
MSAEQRYQTLAARYREAYLTRARECARLTIPALFPLSGHNATSALPTPYQSIGAFGINNLSAKMLLALFPPNTANYRYDIDDFTLQALTQQKGMRAEVEKALSSMERSVTGSFDDSPLRTGLSEAFKQLLVAGNVLTHFRPNGTVRVYRLDQYVVRRSPAGVVLEVVALDVLAREELPKEVQDRVPLHGTSQGDAERTVEVYTHIRKTPQGWTVHQELKGSRIPGTSATYPEDGLPYLALRLSAQPNEDYGRSYVDEYKGDLYSLEMLQKALVQGAAAAAKVLMLVKPNSTTRILDITGSESGDVKVGNAEDVTILQLDKMSDFRFAIELRNELVTQLSRAFLLTAGIIRDAERVTAEEIRALMQDLDQGLGGLYTLMATELHLPLIKLRTYQLQRAGRLPTLPKGIVTPKITTGLAALGRGNDVAKLRQLASILQEALGPEGAMQALNPTDFAARLVAGLGIDGDGLVKTREDLLAEQQAEQQASMAEAAAGPMINAAAAMAQQGAPA